MCVDICPTRAHLHIDIAFKVVHYAKTEIHSCPICKHAPLEGRKHHLFLPTRTHLNQPDSPKMLPSQATDTGGPTADTVTLTLRHASTLLERTIQVSASCPIIPSDASLLHVKLARDWKHDVLGPPKGSFLEGKWDPGYFREI